MKNSRDSIPAPKHYKSLIQATGFNAQETKANGSSRITPAIKGARSLAIYTDSGDHQRSYRDPVEHVNRSLRQNMCFHRLKIGYLQPEEIHGNKFIRASNLARAFCVPVTSFLKENIVRNVAHYESADPSNPLRPIMGHGRLSSTKDYCLSPKQVRYFLHEAEKSDAVIEAFKYLIVNEFLSYDTPEDILIGIYALEDNLRQKVISSYGEQLKRFHGNSLHSSDVDNIVKKVTDQMQVLIPERQVAAENASANDDLPEVYMTANGFLSANGLIWIPDFWQVASLSARLRRFCVNNGFHFVNRDKGSATPRSFPVSIMNKEGFGPNVMNHFRVLNLTHKMDLTCAGVLH